MVIGMALIVVSILMNFSLQITGFSVFESTKTFNPIFIITFLFGFFMVAISGKDVSGGLEQALSDDVVGVVSFVRHGDKDKEGNLSPEGKKQAKALGNKLKEIYDARNQGNLYLATSSSPLDRAYDTVKEIMGAESKYNKPIMKDERLIADFEGEVMDKYMEVYNKKGKSEADNWYIDSEYGQGVAENFASFLESNKGKFEKLKQKGKKFHYIAGTHEGFPEALLKRVLVREKKKVGFDKVEEVGGTLGFTEPVNFMLKKDGSYQINFRNQVYDVDMNMLHKLAEKNN